MSESYLVDSGVFIRWYVDQVGHEHARDVQADYLAGAVSLETVDLVRFEVADVLRRKGLLPGRLVESDYIAAVRAIDDLGIGVHVTDVDALERSATLAARRMLAFNDAVLVDRALETGRTLLTSDAGLCRAVDGLLSTELLRGTG